MAIGKSNTKLYTVILFLFIATLQISCSKLYVGNVKEVRVESFTLQSVKIEVTVPVKNGNAFKYTITEVKTNVNVNGIDVGKLVSNENIVIPAHSSQNKKFILEIKLNNFLNSAASLISIATQPEINLKLKGYIKGSVLGFSKVVDIEQEQKISLSKN